MIGIADLLRMVVGSQLSFPHSVAERTKKSLGAALCQRSCRLDRIRMGTFWGRWTTELARYGQAYMVRIVARLSPPESSSVEHVSREVGVSVATLERWRADALANGPGGDSQRWTAARLQSVIATEAMDEATRGAWCRKQGLYPTELDAIAGLGEPHAASAVEARQAGIYPKRTARSFKTGPP